MGCLGWKHCSQNNDRRISWLNLTLWVDPRKASRDDKLFSAVLEHGKGYGGGSQS